MRKGTVEIVYLPGNDTGELCRATPGSAAYDLPAVLSRPFLDVNKKPHFSWQSRRFLAFNKPSTPQDKPVRFDLVTEWLREVRPEEAKQLREGYTKFPHHHLALKVLPNETVLVPLGIQTAFHPTKVALLFSRASSATKQYRLGNCVGVIDSDYREEWYAAIRNSGTQPLVVEHGKPLVQVLFVDLPTVELVKVDELSPSSRLGGFGSTDNTTQPTDAVAEDTDTEAVLDDIEPEGIYLSAGNVKVGPLAEFIPGMLPDNFEAVLRSTTLSARANLESGVEKLLKHYER